MRAAHHENRTSYFSDAFHVLGSCGFIANDHRYIWLSAAAAGPRIALRYLAPVYVSRSRGTPHPVHVLQAYVYMHMLMWPASYFLSPPPKSLPKALLASAITSGAESST